MIVTAPAAIMDSESYSVALVLMVPAALVLFATVPVLGAVVSEFPVLPLVVHRTVILRWVERDRS